MEKRTLEELTEALESDLENQELRMTLVRRLMEEEEWKEAAEWVLGASQIVGAEARNQAAWACFGAGLKKEALTFVEDSPESLGDSGSPLGLLLLGGFHEALQERQFEEAEEILRRLERAPESYRPHVYLGHAELMKLKGQRDEARYYLEKSLKLRPDNPRALFEMATHYFAQGELGEAERMILHGMEQEAGLEVDPALRNSEVRALLGRIQLKKGRVAEARQIAAGLLADLLSKSEGLELMTEVQEEIHPLRGAWWKFIRQLEGHEKAGWLGWILGLALLLAIGLSIALQFTEFLKPYELWIEVAGLLPAMVFLGIGPVARYCIRREILSAQKAGGGLVPAPSF